MIVTMLLFSAAPCVTMLHTGVESCFGQDPKVIPIEPGDRLYNWIEKLGNLLAGWKTLFLIDDIIANETLDKKRHPLLELAVS